MKKITLLLSFLVFAHLGKSVVHTVFVWNGYLQFVDSASQTSNTTIQLGDTVRWLPLDAPTMTHTITSTNIPGGAAAFDQVWQLPSDTFFQYVPAVAGLYEYQCTPHASFGMTGTITVQNGPTGGINAGFSDEELSLFPNPATTHLVATELSGRSFSIFSATGLHIVSGISDHSIDISDLPNGVYVIQLNGLRPRSTRFIKH